MQNIMKYAAPFALCVLAACGADSTVDEIQDSSAIIKEIKLTPLECEQSVRGEKSLLWGDLHVHTALSLDVFGFGTFATPVQAYAFAAGDPMKIGDETVQLDRPLDFTAVTDHAEWLDMLHICLLNTCLGLA